MPETEDKRTRKNKDQKQRDKAQKVILDNLPDMMDVAIKKAIGVARKVTCPHCNRIFDLKVGDKSYTDLLKSLLEHGIGKPKMTGEAEDGKGVDLDSGQLLRLYDMLMAFKKEREATEAPEVVAAEFKAIKEPELPVEQPTIVAPIPQNVQNPVQETIQKTAQPIIEGNEQYAVKQ